MKTILIPQPVYPEITRFFIEDTEKENLKWINFGKYNAIEKARILAEEQHKKVANLIKVLNDLK